MNEPAVNNERQCRAQQLATSVQDLMASLGEKQNAKVEHETDELFEALCNLLEPDLRRFLHVLLIDDLNTVMEAEILLNVVWTKMLLAFRAKQFDSDRGFWPWLKTITRNAVRDYQRYQSSGKESVFRGASRLATADVVEESGNPLLHAELTSTLLSRLPERERQAMQSYYLQGRSTLSIAEDLGTTAPAVRGLLRRARNRLQKQFQNEL